MIKIAKVLPVSERISLPPAEMNKLITTYLCTLTEKTINELGYVGSSTWIKDNKRTIVSKFKYSEAMESKSGGFGSKMAIKEWIDKLSGYFYYGDIDSYVYDMDIKSDTLIIRWHTDLLLATITDTSLSDRHFKISHTVITNSKQKKDHTPIILHVDRAHCNNADEPVGYDPKDIPGYFESLYK